MARPARQQFTAGSVDRGAQHVEGTGSGEVSSSGKQRVDDGHVTIV
jgi:hypothetical protein